MATFVLKQEVYYDYSWPLLCYNSRAGVTETLWPSKPKILSGMLQKKFPNPLHKNVKGNKSIKTSLNYLIECSKCLLRYY